MEDYKIIFTKYDTVISGIYEELPTDKFFKRLEKDIRKGKYKDATYNADILVENFIFSKDGTKELSLNYDEELMHDLINHIATDRTVKVYRFIKVLKLQESYDDIRREKEAKEEAILKEERWVQHIINNGDNGTIETEEKKEIYLKYLKQEIKPFMNIKELMLEAKECIQSDDVLYFSLTIAFFIFPFAINAMFDPNMFFVSLYNNVSWVLFAITATSPITRPIIRRIVKVFKSFKTNTHKIKELQKQDLPRVESIKLDSILLASKKDKKPEEKLISDPIIDSLKQVYEAAACLNEYDKERIQDQVTELTTIYLNKKHSIELSKKFMEILSLKWNIIDTLTPLILEIKTIKKMDTDVRQASEIINPQLQFVKRP